VLAGAPGKIAEDFTPDLPKPANRNAATFFEWKKQPTALLSGPAPHAVPAFATQPGLKHRQIV
jgi:hypothetical protein